jgi:hypothetical protein
MTILPLLRAMGVAMLRRSIYGFAGSLLVVAAWWLAPSASATTGCYPACVSPTATVTAQVVSPKQTEHVRGSFWCPGATITVKFDGSTVATATADKNGNFDTSFKIPAGASPGSHTITVTGSAYQCTAPGSVSITVTVVASGSTSATSLTLTGPGWDEGPVPAKSGYTIRVADIGIMLCAVAFLLMLSYRTVGSRHSWMRRKFRHLGRFMSSGRLHHGRASGGGR